MAARLRAAGFAGADVQVFKPAPRKGNLVARLRGTGARRPILLLAHIDVVPANPDDWTTDPFRFTEIDGYYYGRGTGDNKYMALRHREPHRYKQEASGPTRHHRGARDRRRTLDAPAGASSGCTESASSDRCEFALNEGGASG